MIKTMNANAYHDVSKLDNLKLSDILNLCDKGNHSKDAFDNESD